MRFLIITALFVLSAVPVFACQVNDYNKGINSNFNYGGDTYKTVLPFSKLSESKNFDIENADFPVGFGQIIKTAKGLTEKVDPEAAWSVESVGLNKYNYSSCIYWYYQINMRSSNPNNNYLYLNIGINGEKPNIYKIKEVLLE